MAPDSLVARIQAGYIEFQWKGDTTVLRRRARQGSRGRRSRWHRDRLQMGSCDAGARFRPGRAGPRGVAFGGDLLSQRGRDPEEFPGRLHRAAQGVPVLARSVSRKLVRSLKARSWKLRAAPSARRTWACATLFSAAKTDAIREGRKAVELKPETKDAYDGAIMNCFLALIYTRLGETDLAIPLIERLLRTPGAVDTVNYSMTVNDLKLRFEWDLLRTRSPLQALISTP